MSSFSFFPENSTSLSTAGNNLYLSLLRRRPQRRRTTSGADEEFSAEPTRTIPSPSYSGSYQSPKRRKKKPSFLMRLLRVVMVLFILGILVGVLGVGFIFFRTSLSLPPFDPEKLSSSSNSLMYDGSSNLIYELHSGENRRLISLEQVPDELLHALLATEDRNFYIHHGVDLKGVIRSFVANFITKSYSQGGSTITQQLARQSYLTLEKTYERKIKEILLAFQIESNFSKDEILTFYLNKMNFGAGAYGVQAAAEAYFGKDVSELNLPQCAMIVGLLQAPSAYNPLLYYDKAKARQQIILNNMVAVGYISEYEARQAFEEDLGLLSEEESVHLTQNKSMQTNYGFYIDAVIEEALAVLQEMNIENPETAVFSGGLSIYTNLDERIQDRMNAIYADDSYFPDITYDGMPMQSASVVMENATGKVLALIGGRQYEVVRGFNRATQALRQPGSCIKPLTVYSPALETGVMPYKVYEDAPISYLQPDGTYWKPVNYDGSWKGHIPMRTAVQWSVNTYAIQLLDEIGVRTGFDYGVKVGLPLLEGADLGLAPLALGGLTKGVTPLQMAAGYATLGNDGIYNEPHLINKIYDDEGTLIYSIEDETPTRVFSPETTWLMTSMLQTVTASGTGTPGKVANVPTAGKTGTSEEKSNAWFCGYTPKYACAVWFGFDEVHAMPGVYGSDAAKIFREIMTTANDRGNPGSFDSQKPKDIVSINICKYDGKLASSGMGGSVMQEYCVKGMEPDTYSSYSDQEESETTVCANTGLLPSEHCPTITVHLEEDEIPTEVCTSCLGNLRGVHGFGDTLNSEMLMRTSPITSDPFEPVTTPIDIPPVVPTPPPTPVSTPTDTSFGMEDPFANNAGPAGMVVNP